MIPAFEHHPNSRFLGFPMSQCRYAIPAWSFLFEKEIPKNIIEIGTHLGGMTCLLAIAAKNLKSSFCMFDINDNIERELFDGPCWFKTLDIDLNLTSCFSPEGEGKICSIIKRTGLTVLLCDGGNKQKEFQTFAPVLKSGDILGVHDARGSEGWPWQEIDIEANREFIKEQQLEEFMQDIFLQTGWWVCRKK